jgi:hypothetical protein
VGIYTPGFFSKTQFKQEQTTPASLSIANLINFSKMQVNRDAIAIEYKTKKIWNSWKGLKSGEFYRKQGKLWALQKGMSKIVESCGAVKRSIKGWRKMRSH